MVKVVKVIHVKQGREQRYRHTIKEIVYMEACVTAIGVIKNQY